MKIGRKTIAGLLIVVAILLTFSLSLDVTGQRRRIVTNDLEFPIPDPFMPAPHEVEEHQHQALIDIATEIRLLRKSVEALGPQISVRSRP